MKKYCVLLAGFLLICCGACKKDNKSTPVSIAGKWHPVKIIMEDYVYSTHDLDTIDSFPSAAYIQFNADGTGIADISRPDVLGILTGDFKYTVFGDTLKYTSYSYSIGSIAPNTVYSIVKMTQNNLEIHSDMNFLSDGSTNRRIETDIFSRN